MLKISLIYFVVTVFIGLGYVTPIFAGNEPQWDLLIFTQRWPITVCLDWESKGPNHTCSLSDKPDDWKVHGIWPTRLHTMGPEFCNKTWHFDPEEVKPIETNLTENWTNIEIEGATYSFWAHEWNKHGTCAAPVVEAINTQLKYFTQGLKLLDMYSMSDILSSAGIVPTYTSYYYYYNSYSLADINRAIKQRVGVNPVIECREFHGRNYLFELRVCFDKNFNFENCDGVVTSDGISKIFMEGEQILTNCHPDNYIVYPLSDNFDEPPNMLYVQLYRFIEWLRWFTL